MAAVAAENMGAQTRWLVRASLVLGIIGFFSTAVGIGVLLAFAAIGCATMALVRLRPWHPHDGHAMAIAGLICGVAALLTFPVWIAAVVPRFVAAHRERQAAACGTIVHGIDEAKAQWAIQHNAKNGWNVPTNELFALPPFHGVIPRCPGGGRYRINPVGVPAECSIPSHDPARR